MCGGGWVVCTIILVISRPRWSDWVAISINLYVKLYIEGSNKNTFVTEVKYKVLFNILSWTAAGLFWGNFDLLNVYFTKNLQDKGENTPFTHDWRLIQISAICRILHDPGSLRSPLCNQKTQQSYIRIWKPNVNEKK